jgi:anthranilate phosphoribosyltransferase
MVTEYDARAGDVRTYRIAPADVGLGTAAPGALAGGDVAENTRITLAVLSGESGPRRDVTLMNAGAGIYAAEAASSIAEGVEVARMAINSGQAMKRLERLVALSRELGAEEEAARSAQV